MTSDSTPDETREEGEALFFPNRNRNRRGKKSRSEKSTEASPKRVRKVSSNNEPRKTKKRVPRAPVDGASQDAEKEFTGRRGRKEEEEIEEEEISEPIHEDVMSPIPEGFAEEVAPILQDQQAFQGDNSQEHTLTLTGLGPKDMGYIQWMANYLSETGVIRFNEPHLVLTFALKHLLYSIQSDIEATLEQAV